MNQARGLVILFMVSYLIHAMLLVNSAESELHNAQKQVGALLADQLATSAAPLLMNKDSVGLGLLANRVGETPAILGLRIINNASDVVATAGNAPSQQGRRFSTPIELEKQTLGTAEITLASPARGDIIRDSALNLLLSLALHAFMAAWIGWPQLFRGRFRIPILQALPPESKPVEPAPEPKPVEPEPEPVKPAASVLVQFAFDDRKNLLQKVNVSTSDLLLQLTDKLLRRAARLNGGKIVTALSADGAVVRFDGDTAADCMNRALVCSRLFLKLTDTAYQQRRQAKQFALRMMAAGVELGEQAEADALKQAQRMIKAATVNQVLISASEPVLTELQAKHQLKAFEAEEGSEHAGLQAQIVESLAESVETEIGQIEKRILERRTTVDAPKG